jgi:hypothetical protein
MQISLKAAEAERLKSAAKDTQTNHKKVLHAFQSSINATVKAHME